MNNKILIVLGLVWIVSGFSQNTNTPLTDSYQPPQTVINVTVQMLPGFHADSKNVFYNNGGEFIARSKNYDPNNPDPVITNPPVAYNPANGENYIYTRSYLAPVTSSNNYAPQVQSITYFDGLGRPKQNIAIKSSTKGNDLVTPIVYDNFGRQTRDYLPIPQSGTKNAEIYMQNSSMVDFPVANSGGAYPSVEKIFSEKKVENSPLDRVLEQYGAGADWQSNSKRNQFDYQTNIDGEVISFAVSTSWSTGITKSDRLYLSDNSGSSFRGYYKAAMLYKNKVTDEDDNVSYEFKNGQGQTLLVRKMLTGTQSADTYYVYNEYNQLAFVIPPLAVKSIQDDGWADGEDVPGDLILNLCYQYLYDGRNRLAQKKLPGKGWEYMVYDKADRLILTQDTRMKTENKWLITKYDKFGRVIYTGFLPRSQSRESLQGEANNHIITETPDATGFTKSGIQIYYKNDFFTDISEILSVNYYDTYPAYPDTPTFGEYDQYGQKFLTQNYASSDSNSNTRISTKGLPTASLVKTIDANTWTKTFTFYDQKARPIYTQSNNHLGGYTITASLLDFSGTVQKSYTRHKRSSDNTTPEVTINERFVYDHQNRLKQHYHQVDGRTEVLLTDNTYDELGRLRNKKVGNDLQSMGFDYNIRGWMTGINKNDISVMSPYTLNNGKLFGYEIRYNNPKNESVAAKKYNGNIAEVEWIKKDEPLKRYGYQYDKLNRLLAGIYQDPESTVPETHANDEVLTYDLNGNIKTLVRTAPGFKNRVAVIDDLTYGYEGNKVTNINDQSDNPSGYEGGQAWIPYDANGNMTAMPDKGINDIFYNYLNLPKQINQNDNILKYDYRADGVKLKKRFTFTNASGSHLINTEYLDGFQYSTPNTQPIRRALEETDHPTMKAATAGEPEAFSVPDQLLVGPGDGGPIDASVILSFFPTAEGYYDYENKLYIYQYKDHLGNVRISYTKSGTGEIKIMDSNDYYPFGMNFLKKDGGNSYYDPMAIPYNYKYNGKELQETGMYDYGARFYMPDIGRWGVIDPLAEQYRRWSPYTYGVDNPIKFFDPDGRGVLTDYYNLKGQLTKHVEDGKTDKKIVLTTSKKEADTDAAIGSGHVINQVTNDQIKQIDAIYTFGKTDKTGTEKGFLFGQNGNSSKTVTGEKSGEVGSKEWADANKDLKSKGDTTASDAHLHPLHYDKDGNVTSYGVPTPSPTDMAPQNMKGNQPSMVLGWTENQGSLPSGQIGGTPSPNTYSPTVGFYNTGGSIITIDYSTFKKAMEKVNK